VALVSWLATARARRKEPAVYAENRAHLARLNSLPVLVGRTIILELVRA
jgi:hypothetical protein